MRILVVHPLMSYLGGGERLCCATIRTLVASGNQVTLLGAQFDTKLVEDYFGYERLFNSVNLWLYPSTRKPQIMASTQSLIHNIRKEEHLLRHVKGSLAEKFDIMFSTQDPGYIPDIRLPTIQWGYFPRIFPNYSLSSIPKLVRSLPIRFYYERKVSRIGLVLAISLYSKFNLDKEWKRPSVLVYPPCNMVPQMQKRNLVVTVARASPLKRLDEFWKVARLRPQYEFVMLLTRDPHFVEYSRLLYRVCPENGSVVLDPPNETYHKFLGKAKAYLHLMRGEHFGISVVEAMSAGCVPVVHDSGGPKEIVSDGTGFRWRDINDIPRMLDEAIRISPSKEASRRAQDFSVARFDSTLSSVLHGLRS
jgi:alpha-1,2-mannosyltransferase